MFKNTASQKLIVFAFDSTTNLPKTGDAANLTAYVSKDFGAVTVLGDTSATEMDATLAKGYYLFDLAQAETNADTLLFSAKSNTASIVVIAVPATVYTVPPNFTAQSIDANGRVDVAKIAGTAQTARDIGASVVAATVSDKSGYTLAPGAIVTATFGTCDFTAAMKTSLNAATPAVTVSDKTGFSLANGSIVTASFGACDFTPTMKTSIGTAVAASAVASVTGNVGGNVVGSVGSVAAGVTLVAGQHVIVDSGTVTTLTNLPAIPANWITTAGIADGAITAAKVAQATVDKVWDTVLASHLTGGTTGHALNAAGAAGDPWSTALPGAYSAGSAGYIVGNRIDAAISSRMATYVPPTLAAIASAVWQDATAGDFTTAGSIGKSLFTSGNAPGAAGGHLIAGANAATTVAAMNITGALSVGGGMVVSNPDGDGILVTSGDGNAINLAASAGCYGIYTGIRPVFNVTILNAQDMSDTARAVWQVPVRQLSGGFQQVDVISILGDEEAAGTLGNILGDYYNTASKVSGIKAKTDQLSFVGGKVDGNASVSLSAQDKQDIVDGVVAGVGSGGGVEIDVQDVVIE